MMQAFANREAVKATLSTGKVRVIVCALQNNIFYDCTGYVLDAFTAALVGEGRDVKVRWRSRFFLSSRPSSNFIHVTSVHVDCDGDSLIYMGVPDGPSCHTARGGAVFLSFSSPYYPQLF